MVAIFAMCLFLWSDLAAGIPAFTLERSTNRNLLLYDIDFERTELVHPSWRMLESDGHLEELTFFEHTNLYGARVISRGSKSAVISLAAAPDFRIHVSSRADGIAVSIPELGFDVPISRFFVNLSGGLIPRLRSILIYPNGGEAREGHLKGSQWAVLRKDER